jgi:hypothetical protein
MKIKHDDSSRTHFLIAAMLLAFSFPAVPNAFGQTAGLPLAGGPEVYRDVRYPEWQQKQLLMKSSAARSADPFAAPRVKWKRVRAEFLALQVAGHDLHRLTATNPDSAENEVIGKKLNEVNRRAKKLRLWLSLSKAEKDDLPKSQPVTVLKNGILELDKLIIEFSANPIFKNPYLLDLTAEAKASRDLEKILVFSKQLKKLTTTRKGQQ